MLFYLLTIQDMLKDLPKC